MGRKKIDLAGIRFGKLVAVSVARHGNGSRVYWECLCDCGNTVIVSNDHLRNGDRTDCGCCKRHITRWKKHGMCNDRIYRIWSLMKERCYNPKRKDYKNYGGRGVTVCQEWLDSGKFIEWAFANGYNDDLTIDRIDNNKGYCPENCRWVSREEQQRNRRCNRLISYGGETKTITQWALENRLTYAQLNKRLQLGWSFEKAITQPIIQKYSCKKENTNGRISIQ